MALRNSQKKNSKHEIWELRLYVAGQTPKSLAAFANLKKICEEHLMGRYSIEVIDLLENPRLAKGDQILAIPTLVRRLPEPVKKIIGSLAEIFRGRTAAEWFERLKNCDACVTPVRSLDEVAAEFGPAVPLIPNLAE